MQEQPLNKAHHSLPLVAGTPNPLARFCRPCALRYVKESILGCGPYNRQQNASA